MLVKPRFVFPGKSSYDGRDHLHVETSVEVGVPDIPGRICICNLLALLGAHPILHVSRIRVKLVKDPSEAKIENK